MQIAEHFCDYFYTCKQSKNSTYLTVLLWGWYEITDVQIQQCLAQKLLMKMSYYKFYKEV
jgi:hypothetical protein